MKLEKISSKVIDVVELDKKKKNKAIKITESYIKNALESTEIKTNTAKVSSTLTNTNLFTYSPLIEWKDFSLKKTLRVMCEFSKLTSGIELYPYQLEPQRRIFESVLKNDGEEITALFSRQCIPKDSIIYMSDGSYKFIQDIKIGDEILSINNNKIESDIVEDFWVTEKKVCREIKTNRGFSNITSLKHLYYTPNGWLEAGKLNTYKDNIINSICGSIYRGIFGNESVGIDKIAQINISDNIIPNIIFKCCKEEVALFLNKLYATFGYFICKKFENGIGLICNNIILAKQVQFLLHKFGIGSYYKLYDNEKNKKSFYKLFVCKSTDIITFLEQIGYIYGKEGQSKELLNLTKTKNKDQDQNYNIENDISWDTIVEISDNNEVIMYDIRTKSNHNFICNGFIVHNSGKTEMIATTVITLMVFLPVLAKVFPDKLGIYRRGFKVGLFAPVAEQAFTTHERMDMRLSSEFADEILSDDSIKASKKYHGGVLHIMGPDEKLPSGKIISSYHSYCKIQSAAKQSKIESKTYDFVIIEEAQEVDTMKVQKSIHPMLSSCVCKNQFVFDSNGKRIPIQNFVDNKVLSTKFNIEKNHKVSAKTVLDDVKILGSTGFKNCVFIKTDTGRTIECSNDHPLMYFNEFKNELSWVSAKDVTLNDSLAVADDIPFFGKKELFNARFIGMQATEKYHIYKELFKNTDNKYDSQYLIKNNKISKNKFINKLKYKFKNFIQYAKIKQNNKIFKNIDKYSKNDACELLGGIFDIDGYIDENNKKYTINLHSMQEKYLFNILLTLNKLGIHGNIKKFKNSLIYVLCISDELSIIRFYDNIKLLDKYKQDKLNVYVCILKKHTLNKNILNKYVDGLKFEKVTFKQNLGIKKVYNFTTEKTHTYLVNGFVTHNTNGTMVKIGTPMPIISDFYNAILRNIRKEKQTKIKNHFEYNYKVTQKYNERYKSYIQREKERLGEQSDAFRMAYSLEWLLEKGMALTPQMFEEYLKWPRGHFEYESDGIYTYVAGLDLAKKKASTVLTIAKIKEIISPVESDGEETFFIKEIVNWLELQGDDWESQFTTIKHMVYAYNLSVLCVDSTGVGDVIVDRLEKALYDSQCVIHPVVFNLQSKHDMATIFYRELRARRIRVPTFQNVTKTVRFKNFYEQLTSCQKVYTNSFMQLKKQKDDETARDDYVDSLLLLVYGVENQYSPLVKEDENVFIDRGNLRQSKILLHSDRFKKGMSSFKKKQRASLRRKIG